VGLPTRVAIGFTPGVRDLAGQTVVRGIDAHAWPEVYLNGSWISFEPTPQLPSGQITPPGVVGPAALGNPNPIGPTTIPSSIPQIPLPSSPPITASAPASGNRPWWLVGVAVTALVGVAVVVAFVRRRARVDRGDEVLGAWNRVERALVRRGVARPMSKTPVMHVRSLQQTIGAPGAVLEGIGWLATLVEHQAYGSRPVSRTASGQAKVLSQKIERELLRRRPHAVSGTTNPLS